MWDATHLHVVDPSEDESLVIDDQFIEELLGIVVGHETVAPLTLL